MDEEITAALELAMQRAADAARVPWTDESVLVLREAAEQVEARLTDADREALAAARSTMSAEDWDAFATAMVRPVRPDVDGC